VKWWKGMMVVAVLGVTAMAAAEEVTWRSKMRELSQALSDIVPDLFSGINLRDRQQLENKMSKIYAISNQLDQSSGHGVKVPDGDPTIPFVASMFNKDIERAYHGLQNGQVEYSKMLMRSSVSYCITCHTRSQMGPKFPLLNAFSEPLKKAPWIDRITFQAASRQFDAVNQAVSEQLGAKPAAAKVSPLELEKSVRIALAIAVRVQQSPQQAADLVAKIMASSQATADLKKNAEQWNKDILAWKAERPHTYNTDVELVEAARRLVGRAAEESFSSSRPGAEIRYLRASLLMHELLRRFPDSSHSAEGLFLIGLSYDVLQDLGLWSLHEMYYEACIEKQPHSGLARRCYERYKDSIILGYSGSSGVHVPADVRLDLSRLEILAKPQ